MPAENTKLREVETKVASTDLVPEYKSEGAAGADLYANLGEGNSITVQPGEVKTIPSGVNLNMQDMSIVVFLLPRSSLGKKGIKLANTVGVIDSDYLGDLIMLIENTSKEPFIVHHKDRLAQLVVLSTEQVNFKVVDSFSTTTSRGSGAFGSTGV